MSRAGLLFIAATVLGSRYDLICVRIQSFAVLTLELTAIGRSALPEQLL